MHGLQASLRAARVRGVRVARASLGLGGEQVALGFVFRQPQKIQHARKSVGNVMGVLGRAYSDGIKKLNYQAWGHGMWEIGSWRRTCMPRP